MIRLAAFASLFAVSVLAPAGSGAGHGATTPPPASPGHRKPAATTHPTPAQSGPAGGVTSMNALRMLKEGNERFAEGMSEHPNQTVARRRQVAKKQTPHTVVITCSDSRLSPEFIFDQGIGDLFVVRVAGNTLADREIGSAEYAAEHLGSRLIVILGHSQCGAVKAALSVSGSPEALSAHQHGLPGAIDAVVDPILPAVKSARGYYGDPLANAIRENVRLTAARLAKSDELMRGMLASGQVKVVGAVYDLASGRVEFLK